MSAGHVRIRRVAYPESDGKPMAETDIHRDWMFQIIDLLKGYFLGQRVYVSGNLLIYYVEGDPKKSLAPDVFVVKDCDPRRRRIFKIWEEKLVPFMTVETTSRKTRREDLGKKKKVYAELGIREYFLFDPLEEWLHPPLQGFRLVAGEYERIDPSAAGGLESELGITFRLIDGALLLFDTATGKLLLTPTERKAAEHLADAERKAAHDLADAEARRKAEEMAASARIMQLEEQLARLRDAKS
jgi:Uma2 family endonuclease